MKVTKVKINLVPITSNSRLRAYASVIFDDSFVVSNLRIIEGKKGLFIAMPSRERTRLCPVCKAKVSYRDSFCKKCGQSLTVVRQAAYYKDVAYPLTKEFNQYLTEVVLQEYNKCREEESKNKDKSKNK